MPVATARAYLTCYLCRFGTPVAISKKLNQIFGYLLLPLYSVAMLLPITDRRFKEPYSIALQATALPAMLPGK
jgi:hypothetical protein